MGNRCMGLLLGKYSGMVMFRVDTSKEVYIFATAK